MKLIFRFKKSIALGQKTKQSPHFGWGFNYVVEAGFVLNEALTRERALTAFDQTLKGLDHRALNVDVDLGFEPTSARLCRYIQAQISERLLGAPVAIHLVRGDGAEFSTPAN